MATADTAAKARISKLLKNIEAAGLQPPTYPDDMAPSDIEPLMRAWWNEHKPTTDDLQALRSRADLLGVPYDNETSEEALRAEVQDYEKMMRERSSKHMADRKEQREAAKDDSNELLKEFAKELGGEFAKAMHKPEKGAERVVYDRDFDPDDITEAKTYFAPSSWWKLPMKRRGGQLTPGPFGPILFKMIESESVRVGDRNQVRFLCAYTTDSKREQQYMETHEFFGKKFFLSEDKAKVTHEDTEYAKKFGEIFTMMLTYQAPDIYRMAGELRAEGLSLSKNMDLNAIRTEIAGHMARKALKESKAQRHELLSNSARHELLTTT